MNDLYWYFTGTLTTIGVVIALLSGNYPCFSKEVATFFLVIGVIFNVTGMLAGIYTLVSWIYKSL